MSVVYDSSHANSIGVYAYLFFLVSEGKRAENSDYQKDLRKLAIHKEVHLGNAMKREEAIALLKQIAASERFGFNWISLVNGKAGCEIHIKPEAGSDPEVIKSIFKNRDLQMKEVHGTLVIYREH